MNNDAQAFVTAARNMPLLDREQEAKLLRRFRVDGDREAAEAIARAYQRSVVSIALKYRHYNVSLADLIAEGNLGLIHALQKFDVDRGLRFGTYAAYWIRAEMLAHVIKSRSIVGGSAGAWRSKFFFKLRRERARVTNQFGLGEVADQELAGRLGVPVERVQMMLQRLDSNDVSIEGSVGSWGRSPLDRLEAESNQERDLSKHQFEHSAADAIRTALSRLDARERFIIENRFMTDSEPLPLARIARQFAISRERTRQLETRAMSKLRRAIKDAKSPTLNEWIRDTIGQAAASQTA
jgi:RNA polymerase sigma-32 factor